jgi:hypothetical protein
MSAASFILPILHISLQAQFSAENTERGGAIAKIQNTSEHVLVGVGLACKRGSIC